MRFILSVYQITFYNFSCLIFCYIQKNFLKNSSTSISFVERKSYKFYISYRILMQFATHYYKNVTFDYINK